MEHTSKIKVAILENHQSIIDGYLYRLSLSDEFEVVGAIYYGADLDAFLKKHLVDVLILAAYVPISASDRAAYPVVNVIPSILAKYPGLRILIVSMFANPTFVRAVSELGVSGYILKNDRDSILKLDRIVKKIAMGDIYYSEEIENSILPKAGNHLLTLRQLEILSLFAASPDCTTGNVAQKLGVADSTVRNLLSRVYKTLEVHNRMSAVSKAQKLGMLPGLVNIHVDGNFFGDNDLEI
jgi:DNA-binding NarL/FixJ family response regulator